MNQHQTAVIVFESTDGNIQLQVTTDYDTVWLSLVELAALFQRDKSVISRHIRNIYKEGELARLSTVAKFATVQIEGDRKIQRDIEYYNLDVIISVGYRVKSKRGVEFRQWATQILRQYLVEGYAVNFKRIQKTPGSLVELFKMQVQLWEQQELLNQEIKEDIHKIGDKIQAIEARLKSTDDNYFTIAGYCALHKIACPLHKAQAWGKAAVALSRQKGIATGTAHDERFGKVRTYHRDVLKMVVK
ncbi:MAG TPA: hypothetical protein ENJ95_24805 [Bacteroidetes bacterium]|nr:hypothetical protein [Bacteroidota bacterium]